MAFSILQLRRADSCSFAASLLPLQGPPPIRHLALWLAYALSLTFWFDHGCQHSSVPNFSQAPPDLDVLPVW
jgi:hypothetical protein